MKGLIKYFIVYLIGLFFVFAIMWRYDGIKIENQSLNSSTSNIVNK